MERNLIEQAANLIFPPEAAPLATNYQDQTAIRAWNTFIRSDYQMTATNNLSFRWVREAAITDCEDLQDDLACSRTARSRTTAGSELQRVVDVGDRQSRDERVQVVHVRENLIMGSLAVFGCTTLPCDSYDFLGLNGRDQFDFVSKNEHEDYVAGPSTSLSQDLIRTYGFENVFTFIKPGWGGDHTFKAGFGMSRNSADPQEIGGNQIGTFEFLHNLNFVEGNASTYPSVFSVRLGTPSSRRGTRGPTSTSRTSGR